MNREIEFRGWHIKQKKMYSPEEMAQDQLTLLPTGQFINVSGKSTNLSKIFTYDEFLPLQFTGLLDKNGKKIFEGDVVEMLDEWIDHYTLYSNHQIEFGSGTFRLENGVPLLDCLDEESNFEKCDFEIVGNIYENPNLILEERDKKGVER